MSETKLPKRQQEVLDFLRRSITERGYVPSIREIVEALGVHSTSTIHYHLTGLAERGLIRWDKGKNRAIQVLDMGPAAPVATLVREDATETARLPIAGRIAAGSPIEAIEDATETLDLKGLWATNGNFVLEVTGESMIEDHIMPGDMVIVKPQATARDGEIVVALLETGEATLKRIYKERGGYRLQPANATMAPIFVDRVQVQGRVIGVVRQEVH
ncbi:transcriptional repressor LexA [bacterium]|nr:transcriptional repressor LexA [bacterium]